MASKRSRADFESDRSSSHTRPPFVYYGTPLPPLDSQARDDGTYVPEWKQEVRDEHGRRRLHGAFTGGFSAGYFNTVGSKEGWMPSTFVSSRSNRHKDEGSRKVEDLMDAEDLADLEESQKLATQSSFARLGSTESDSLRRGFVTELFHDRADSMGTKLLQKMGWKPGQGLGTKTRRAARGMAGKGTGPHETHLFAPDDVPMISFNRKSDKFGLERQRDTRLGAPSKINQRSKAVVQELDSEDDDDFLSRRQATKKSKPKKSSFGVGVLNDTGSDDDDPYELGPRISYNKVIGGDRKKRAGGLMASTSASKSTSTSQAVLESQRLTSLSSTNSDRRCHDGRSALDGFILAAQKLTLGNDKQYPPPIIPPEWEPGSKLSSDSAGTTFQSTSDAARGSTLDPSKRAALLGEQALPGKSIFDFISASARDKLASATGTNLPQGKGEAVPAGFEATPAQKQRSMWDLVPRLDRSTAQAALDRSAATTGWMPYADDDKKRARYSSFLSVMVGTSSGLPARKDGSTVDEWAAEMGEFAQAAMVFRPVSGLMASRFTTAKVDPNKIAANDASNVMQGTETAGGLAVTPAKPQKEDEDRAEQAAKLGMFGPLTRSVVDFYPTRLTCKRFGVQPPKHVLHGPDEGGNGSGRSEADKERIDVVGKAKLDELKNAAAAAGAARFEGRGGTGGSTSARPTAEDLNALAPEKTAEVNVEQNEALEGKRAAEELFRSIFGDDDDDDG